MTEAAWLVCTDPPPMLEFLQGKVCVRRFRLFAVACCRRVEALIRKTKLGYRAVVTAERMADGLPITENLEDLQLRPNGEAFYWIDGFRQEKINNGLYDAASTALFTLQDEQVFLGKIPARYFETYGLLDAFRSAAWAAAHWRRTNDRDPVKEAVYRRELAEQTSLARDVFGSPFRPLPSVNPDWVSWHDGAIVHIAQPVYDERRFQDLPILADALEEAGCTDPEILGHCRRQGDTIAAAG
jgi:hypothetical protein